MHHKEISGLLAGVYVYEVWDEQRLVIGKVVKI